MSDTEPRLIEEILLDLIMDETNLDGAPARAVLGGRIYYQLHPQGMIQPRAVIGTITDTSIPTMGVSPDTEGPIQVTALAATYLACRRLARQLAWAIEGRDGAGLDREGALFTVTGMTTLQSSPADGSETPAGYGVALTVQYLRVDG